MNTIKTRKEIFYEAKRADITRLNGPESDFIEYMDEQFIPLAEYEKEINELKNFEHSRTDMLYMEIEKKNKEHRQALEEINTWIDNELRYEESQTDKKAKGYFQALHKIKFKFFNKYLEGDKNDKEE